MPEPTYRIAQALHARRAAVGLKKYGQHLSAASPGCMIVHALEEAADQVNYLLAEIQRRKLAIETLRSLIAGGELPDYEGATVATIQEVIDLLGGEAALAKYDEILGGAEDATVAPDPRDEALRVADAALESCEWNVTNHPDGHQMQFQLCAEKARQARAAIRGAR